MTVSFARLIDDVLFIIKKAHIRNYF